MTELEGERRGPSSSLVAEVVSEAINRAGKALALARRIQPMIGRTYADRTVSAWGRGDVMPPADAVLAAAQVTGVSLDDRLGISREPSALERQLADLQDQFDRQRTVIAAMDQRLEELTAKLEERPVRPWTQGADLAQAEDVLVRLETNLTDLGRLLGRRWDERIAYSDLGASVMERVTRRIGRIEARMAEVGVAAPRGGYPPRPNTDDEDVVGSWVAEELPVLQHQLALVRERAERFTSAIDAASESH